MENLNVSLGWIFTTILVPLLAPNVVMWLLGLGIKQARVRKLAVVKDGQLCWAAVAFSSTGLFELSTTSVLAGPGRGWVGLVGSLMAGAFVAGTGAVFAAPQPLLNLPIDWTEYRLFLASLVITGLSALCLLVVHFA